MKRVMGLSIEGDRNHIFGAEFGLRFVLNLESKLKGADAHRNGAEVA
jgi:hypothetical protein